MANKKNDQNDTPWKLMVENLIEDFLSFFFPKIFEKIDFSKGYRFLSKELFKITKDSEIGKRFADELLEVTYKDGSIKLILIHIEIQSYEEKDFAQRMFTYNYKIRSKFNKDVLSMAVLTDENDKFRPNVFEFESEDFLLKFKFPIIKILDYKDKIIALQESSNPFAVVVLSQLKLFEAKNKPEGEKFNIKLNLIRNLYEKDFSKEKIIELFCFIDWIIQLSKELEEKVQDIILEIEGVKKMPYISTIEKRGIERGIEKGIEKGKLKTAQNMLKDGFTIEQIAKYTELSLKVLKKLSAEK